MKPKVIIFTDIAQIPWSRTGGPYRLATELRKNDYPTIVIDHFLWASVINKQLVFDAIDRFVTEETLAVGFSITFAQKKFFDLHVPMVKRLFDPSIDSILLSKEDGIYAVPLNDEFMQEIKDRILKKNPKTKLVLGGASKNFIDITNTMFDSYIVGFADKTFPGYVKYLDGKNPFFQYRTENNKVIIDQDPGATGFNVDAAYIQWEDEDIMIEGERVPIEISRGCIFKCSFCGYALNGKKKLDYLKSTDILKNEMIRNYEKFGIKDYWFTDDTYNDTPEKVFAIRDMVKELPFDIKFRAYLRLDLLAAHPETVDAINETGLEMTMLGIESLNYENAKLVGKGIRPEKVLKTLEWLWKEKDWDKNVYIMTCIILGLPYDTPDNMTWIDTIDSTDYYCDNICVNPLYISRGTSALFSSTFDKEYDQHGYYFEEGAIWEWKNSNTGMTFDIAQRKVNEVWASLRNKNRAGLLHEYHKNLSKEELYNLAESIYDTNDRTQKWKTLGWMYNERVKLMNKYFTRLLAL